MSSLNLKADPSNFWLSKIKAISCDILTPIQHNYTALYCIFLIELLDFYLETFLIFTFYITFYIFLFLHFYLETLNLNVA